MSRVVREKGIEGKKSYRMSLKCKEERTFKINETKEKMRRREKKEEEEEEKGKKMKATNHKSCN